MAPSPNHGARRAFGIEGIVLHATEDAGHERRSLAWMRSPGSRVSCHLLVGRSGRVTRLVGDQQRAWHAGLSWWRGTSDVNSITLGIEIANRNDGEPFTDAQYQRVSEIVAHYCGQGLSLEDVVGHAEISGGRKTDPLGWDWDRFRALVRESLASPELLPTALPSGEPAAIELDVPNAAARVAPLPEQRVPAVPTPKRLKRPPVIVTPKPIVRSRTLWVNALAVLTAAAALIADALDLAHRLVLALPHWVGQTVQHWVTVTLPHWVGLTLPEEVAVWVVFGVGVLNIVLRLRTTQPLSSRVKGRALSS